MKKATLYSFAIVCLLLTTACGNLIGVNSNSFEFRYPVVRCNAKVKLADPDPKVVLGQQIERSRGIWLLTPDVLVKPPKFHDREDDQRYINRIGDFLMKRIENKFILDEWVAGIIPVNLKESEKTDRDQILGELAANALSSDTINYDSWKAPDALVFPDFPGYSLFIYFEGQIGFNKTNNQDTNLFLFLIDNASSRVTYSDFMSYECDVRNPDGLEKVLDHAYGKLLAVRFPETFNKAN